MLLLLPPPPWPDNTSPFSSEKLEVGETTPFSDMKRWEDMGISSSSLSSRLERAACTAATRAPGREEEDEEEEEGEGRG